MPRHSERFKSTTSPDLVGLLQENGAGRIKRYRRGQMLYWQGDPVELIFVIRWGAVKVSSISAEGKTYTYSILGSGTLLGAAQYLLGQDHDALAEALDETEVIAIRPSEFEDLLATDPRVSAIVMRKLAEGVTSLTGRVRSLSFLDVQQRLKQGLMELAEKYGIVTAEGIKIGLDITHEEIGQLVAANRSTITAYLNEFKKQGYLLQEGRHLIIIPPGHIEVLDGLSRAVVAGDEDDVVHWTEQAIARGVDPLKAFDALAAGMRQVDRMLLAGDIEISDVILSAYVMKRGLATLDGELKRKGGQPGRLGTVVIGTVQGDVHDIGQTIVAMLLAARGFRVIELGVNVATERFLQAVDTHKPDILAMSSLMTTTAPEQRRVIDALKEHGVRDRVLVVVGGGAVTRRFSREIGADGYAPTAGQAVELAWRLISQKLRTNPVSSRAQ